MGGDSRTGSIPVSGTIFPYSSVYNAGWSSLVARRAHNPKVGGSNPPPATIKASENGCLFSFMRNGSNETDERGSLGNGHERREDGPRE